VEDKLTEFGDIVRFEFFSNEQNIFSRIRICINGIHDFGKATHSDVDVGWGDKKYRNGSVSEPNL
jgi:hypothetical protein